MARPVKEGALVAMAMAGLLAMFLTLALTGGA